MPQDSEKLLTPEEVGPGWLQLPVKTLYQWRYEGKGPPCIKVGKHLRYRRGDVARWLEQQAVRSTH